jgi:hypothetical protein
VHAIDCRSYSSSQLALLSRSLDCSFRKWLSILANRKAGRSILSISSPFAFHHGLKILGRLCFFQWANLAAVTFGRDSRLWRIGEFAFSRSHSLASVGIPSSLEVLSIGCFSSCRTLSLVTFESGSRLRRIEKWAFSEGLNLNSLCLPAQVVYIGHCALPRGESIATGGRAKLQFPRLSRLCVQAGFMVMTFQMFVSMVLN